MRGHDERRYTMNKEAIALLLYYSVIVVASLLMRKCGIRVSDWKYWAILGCMIVAHITGDCY